MLLREMTSSAYAHSFKRFAQLAVAGLALAGLAACGGGGGSSTPAETTPTPTPDPIPAPMDMQIEPAPVDVACFVSDGGAVATCVEFSGTDCSQAERLPSRV